MIYKQLPFGIQEESFFFLSQSPVVFMSCDWSLCIRTPCRRQEKVTKSKMCHVLKMCSDFLLKYKAKFWLRKFWQCIRRWFMVWNVWKPLFWVDWCCLINFCDFLQPHSDANFFSQSQSLWDHIPSLTHTAWTMTKSTSSSKRPP